MILAGFYSGEVKHTCQPDNSESWGCEKDAQEPRWNLPCWDCLGEKGNESCQICNGVGQVGQLKCPNSANTGTMNNLFSAFADLKEYGVFPVSGAMLDQSIIFKEVVSLVPRYLNAWATLSSRKREEFERRKRALNGKTKS